jgi:23S rRNA pseudouridine2605 synthase
MEKVRLQKFLADSGVASRRGAEKLIEAGTVLVNGKQVELGQKVDPMSDQVTVDGVPVRYKGEKRYIMLHKPRGVITTMQDERGRRCVAQLVVDVEQRIYPVGRLDRDSEGLLLMTNDGEFANRLMHPSGHVSKTYRVTVRPHIKEEQLSTLSGEMILDGYKIRPAQVTVLQEGEDRTVLQMVIQEGRNRQIRKMCETVGLEVIRLKRTAVGSVKLGMLQPGHWRDLTEAERGALTGQKKTASGVRRTKKNF